MLIAVMQNYEAFIFYCGYCLYVSLYNTHPFSFCLHFFCVIKNIPKIVHFIICLKKMLKLLFFSWILYEVRFSSSNFEKFVFRPQTFQKICFYAWISSLDFFLNDEIYV